MNDIPYVIKKYPMTELDKRDFHLELMKQSITQPYELKQMLPVVSDGETESVYAVFTVNQNLIKTGIFVDGVGVDSKYLTAGQIEMLKNLGTLEVCGEKREIQEVSVQWDTDSAYGIEAEIKLK